MYSCTCLDFLLHTTICKHIHLVCALTNQDINVRSETESADLQYFKDILLHEDDEDSLQSLRIKTLSLVNDLYSSIYTCENQAAILSATKHIKTATNIIKGVCSNPQNKVLPKKQNCPPNVNSVKQLCFFKTNQPRKHITISKIVI